MTAILPPARLAAAGLILLVSGCATTPPAVKPVAPTALPVAVVEANPAHITGSEESSTMLDNFTAFVTAIDGVPVADGRAGWNTPLTLKPGRHHLGLAFNRGVFAARADVELNARSERDYQVRFATDAQLFGKNSFCEFQIVDAATGEAVVPPVRATLLRVEPAVK